MSPKVDHATQIAPGGLLAAGAGDCEQAVKIRNPNGINLDELRLMYISFPSDVAVFFGPSFRDYTRSYTSLMVRK